MNKDNIDFIKVIKNKYLAEAFPDRYELFYNNRWDIGRIKFKELGLLLEEIPSYNINLENSNNFIVKTEDGLDLSINNVLLDSLSSYLMGDLEVATRFKNLTEGLPPQANLVMLKNLNDDKKRILVDYKFAPLLKELRSTKRIDKFKDYMVNEGEFMHPDDFARKTMLYMHNILDVSVELKRYSDISLVNKYEDDEYGYRFIKALGDCAVDEIRENWVNEEKFDSVIRRFGVGLSTVDTPIFKYGFDYFQNKLANACDSISFENNDENGRKIIMDSVKKRIDLLLSRSERHHIILSLMSPLSIGPLKYPEPIVPNINFKFTEFIGSISIDSLIKVLPNRYVRESDAIHDLVILKDYGLTFKYIENADKKVFDIKTNNYSSLGAGLNVSEDVAAEVTCLVVDDIKQAKKILNRMKEDEERGNNLNMSRVVEEKTSEFIDKMNKIKNSSQLLVRATHKGLN